MGWIVRIDLPEIERDLVSSALWDLNTNGIAEIEGDAGAASRAEKGRLLMLAGFDDEAGAAHAVSALDVLSANQLGASDWTLSIEPVDSRTWVESDRREHVVLNGEPFTIEVGGAFGHGGHPTTRLMLGLLADLAPGLAPLPAVLDFGTGTGILAVAAAAHGAGSVLAVDNDPAALAVAERNWERAGRSGQGCSFELLPALPGKQADRFELIMANVLLPVHRDHGAALVAALRPGGSLIVAGILDHQRTVVEGAYPGLRSVREATSGDWLGLVLS